MRVVVLTTSYPRWPGDGAGAFVADSVERARQQGVEVEVVAPGHFRHFGIAYGHGVPENLRRRPWLAPLLPAMLVGFARAARQAAGGADVVHAHWLPSAAVGLTTGKPLVAQLWGTDVELARRAPWLARPVLRRAAVVVGASRALADAARTLGARDARVIPSSVEVPERVGEPQQPPHVLFVGRLSPEKGILEFVHATEGLPRVIVGDGPLRSQVPEAVGFVPRAELARFYERASIVAVPSRREGYGIVCAEAMAHGRPVVASAVGGLLDLVDDGETGLLVPPGDVAALRSALERLLADPLLRRRLGEAGRERAQRSAQQHATASALLTAYRDAVG